MLWRLMDPAQQLCLMSWCNQRLYMYACVCMYVWTKVRFNRWMDRLLGQNTARLSLSLSWYALDHAHLDTIWCHPPYQVDAKMWARENGIPTCSRINMMDDWQTQQMVAYNSPIMHSSKVNQNACIKGRKTASGSRIFRQKCIPLTCRQTRTRPSACCFEINAGLRACFRPSYALSWFASAIQERRILYQKDDACRHVPPPRFISQKGNCLLYMENHCMWEHQCLLAITKASLFHTPTSSSSKIGHRFWRENPISKRNKPSTA